MIRPGPSLRVRRAFRFVPSSDLTVPIGIHPIKNLLPSLLRQLLEKLAPAELLEAHPGTSVGIELPQPFPSSLHRVFPHLRDFLQAEAPITIAIQPREKVLALLLGQSFQPRYGEKLLLPDPPVPIFVHSLEHLLVILRMMLLMPAPAGAASSP